MKLCDAILHFEGTKHFVMCELESGHACVHEALAFRWMHGVTHCADEYRQEAIAKMKEHVISADGDKRG